MEPKTVEGSGVDDFPHELQEQLQIFHNAISNIEKVFSPLLSTGVDDIYKKLTPLEKARLDLSIGYTLNSLFWLYLVTQGVNPKEHAVKQELDRIKGYMNRAKEIADKEKAPKLNTDAAQRFVRSSLWEPETSEDQKDKEQHKRKKKHSEKCHNKKKKLT
ncbi:ribosomal RNA processing 47 [Tachypleus tridentatus]|uniref:ribosomal RNA processing 47 n=1 Tax=Tachypleus tridentatus TaxID=6853 RepID=UPI003FD2949D